MAKKEEISYKVDGQLLFLFLLLLFSSLVGLGRFYF